MTAALEVQTALFDTLRQHNPLIALLGGQYVFDDVPDGARLPYVVFGDVESLDWSTSTEKGEEHLFELEVWSERNGRSQALKIASEIRNALDVLAEMLPAALSEHQLINLSPESTLTTRRKDNRFFMALLTVRLVSEPLSP